MIDTRDLGRRPGSMRRVALTAPAPEGLGIAVLGVPPGSDVALELKLESVMEGVLVSGAAEAGIVGECVRCLDPLERELETTFQELFAYPDVEREPDDEADELRLAGDFLDLEPVLRDAVVLALPLAPLCREDCPGLCSLCGERLADDPEHAHEERDDRWAALEALRTSTNGSTSDTSTTSTTPSPTTRQES